jgi:hypothetical protein
MPTDPPKRRVSPETKAQNLLKRFPIIDLAKAVSLKDQKRRSFLTHFVNTRTTMSYAPTRDAYPMIYAAQGVLLESAPETWTAIETHLRLTARPDILENNVSASKELFDFVRPKNYRATQCETRPLKISLLQTVNIDLSFYITEGEKLIFQFPLVRRECLDDGAIQVLGSIVHHAYAQGDFAAAEIEIADISCLVPGAERHPRLRSVPAGLVLDRPALNEQIEDVYSVLSEIARRPPKPPSESTPMGF